MGKFPVFITFKINPVMGKWEPLLTEMEERIEACWQHQLSEVQQLEMAFKIPLEFWERIKTRLLNEHFDNLCAEIHFYKVIKPQFTSWTEYIPRVYLSLSFVPLGNPQKQYYFWKEESEKLKKFIDKNLDFVEYYRSGRTDRDLQYFLPANYDLAQYKVFKIYDLDRQFMSSYDHLVAELLAQEMYRNFVISKLKALPKSGDEG